MKRLLGVGLIALALFAGCARKSGKAAAIQYTDVARKTIEVTVEATGTVEPIDLIEVKSKASGQIMKMPVAVGSVVKTGDLLAQIDPRDVENSYQQALAAMRAAQAKSDISGAQKKRADDLYNQGVTTADEHESAVLDQANSQSSLVAARTNLDNARQRRDDATVRAPSAGTVLSQDVAVGQVIASATTSVSGGTTLLTMADLSHIRVRALVSETDIGQVRPGLPTTVTVDAFPNRTFQGTVEKIEPQAVVQQSVTMFPVLISLDNENGLLLPGMNGEVSVMVAHQEDVLAVSLDAVRSTREAATVAAALGLNPDSVTAQVQRQVAERMAARGDSTARGGGGGARSDSARAAWRARMGSGGGGGRGGGGRFAGGRPGGAGGAGGTGGGGMSGGGAGGGRGMRAQVAFVQTAKGLEPRLVRLGLSNYDDAQVLNGLNEGDKVALVSVAELQAKRTQDQAQFKSRVSGGTPGLPGGAAGGGGGRGGGGGGGADMLFGETIQVAFEALQANKLRSFLTMLGIVIGVAAVIAMVALGRGASESVKSRIAALGTTLLTVTAGQQRAGGGPVASATDRAPLTLDDAAAITNRAQYVLAVEPEMSRNLQVTYESKNTNTSIVGTTPNYPDVRNYKVDTGRMFSPADDAARRRVAVLGPQVVSDLGLLSGAALIGESVRIDGVQFEVVGVLAPKGQAGFQNPDDQVLIPIQTARYRLIGNDRLRSISVLAPTEDDIPVTMAEVQKILRREHHLRVDAADDFTIRNQADFLTTLGETTQVFTLLLAGIAAVSLLVGGIGIMNIMLVSVTERTREIGLRKALGATQHNILTQFLIEAMVLCMLGGVIGIALGTGASVLLKSGFGWSTSVGASSVLYAFLFSATVGIVFGVWPARRAAGLDPIQALRYE